ALAGAGFAGKARQTLLVPGAPLRVLVGVGDGLSEPAALRDAVAAVVRAAHESAELALDLSDAVKSGIEPELAAQLATEGALLARYRYDALVGEPKTVDLTRLVLRVDGDNSVREAAERGVERGLIL